MELLFESRLNISTIQGRLKWVQGRAAILPDPVIAADTRVDGAGASVLTVLRDGGRYRMRSEGASK